MIPLHTQELKNVPTNVQQSHELPYIVMQQTIYPRNDVTTKQKNFDHPQTLAPTNKNDWTVIIVMTRSCGLR